MTFYEKPHSAEPTGVRLFVINAGYVSLLALGVVAFLLIGQNTLRQYVAMGMGIGIGLLIVAGAAWLIRCGARGLRF